MSGIWPGDIRCVVVLTFDIDGVSGALNADPESARFPGLMSVREYGPSVGVPRILELLDELSVPASFYVPGYVAETHEDMVRDIARRGHEIAHHGYMHEPPGTLSREREIEVLDRGSDILEGLTGRRPVGYRAPSAELSEHTLELLAERGFIYDTSLMGNDIPYLVDAGRRRIVEIPTHWELDDVAYFNYAPSLGIRHFMATPDHVYQVWSAAFEGAYHYGRSLVPMMHPYVIGRPGRLRMLGRLVRDMRGHEFSNPVDLAVSSDDRLYVLSRTNPVQTEGIRVGVLNLDSDYFGDFGSYGSGDGQFVWPTALAFDSRDRLYLADEHNQRITVFDKSGKYLGSWGVEGTAHGELKGPSGLAFDAEDGLYVVDHLNHRVQKFTTGGDWLLGWGREGDAEGEFNLPWGIAVGPDGNVYVADWRNDRVQKFTADGRFMATFGATGGGEGRLRRPAGVAVDPVGRVYVADWGNERVRVFDDAGALLQSLRGEATLSRWGEEFMEANRDQAEARAGADLNPPLAEDVDTPYEESARIERYFWGPVSVKLDREGRLYVIEANRHRVQVYLPPPDC